MDTAPLATLVAVFGVILLLAIHPLWRWWSRRTAPPEWAPDDEGVDMEWRPASRRTRVFAPAPDRRRFWVQAFVTVVVLLAAIYVLVLKPDAETSLKDFCYTSVGAILGFWLKG